MYMGDRHLTSPRRANPRIVTVPISVQEVGSFLDAKRPASGGGGPCAASGTQPAVRAGRVFGLNDGRDAS